MFDNLKFHSNENEKCLLIDTYVIEYYPEEIHKILDEYEFTDEWEILRVDDDVSQMTQFIQSNIGKLHQDEIYERHVLSNDSSGSGERTHH